MNIKTLMVALSLIGLIAGAAWAMDARIEQKVTLQLQPIKDDVRAIRSLLERFVLSQVQSR